MKLNYYAPINSLGYGQVGTNLFVELNKENEVALFPINKNSMEFDQSLTSDIESGINNSHYFDCHAPSIKIWHQWDMALFPGKGQRNGFPIFELNQLTELEKHQLNSLDQVFVCSKWAKSVLENNGINKPVNVVPLGYDPNIFRPRPIVTKSKKTIFINIGKWEFRKGHDILCTAFRNAFTAQDNVELWMINENPFLTSDERNAWISRYQHPKIKLLPRFETQEQLSFVMAKADCGVFPARAEGWNLEILELMAIGIPSIVTNYAGHTEFCDKNNSYLVEIQSLEQANDGKWFIPGGMVNQGYWAALCGNVLDQLVSNLRLVHKNKQENLDNNAMINNCLNTARKFTWKNSATILSSYL